MEATMTADEVAEWLGLSVETIYRKARSGELPALRIGRRWRFLRGALEQWARGEHDRPGVHEPRRILSRDELPKFAVYHMGITDSTFRRCEIYADDDEE